MSWKAAGALILLIAVFALGWYSGALAGRLGKANAAQKQATEQLDKVLASLGEQNKRAEKLQKTLDRLPKSEGRVREIVRDNPSGCVLPPAVVDGLREAIRSANAARALPSDS
jgi:type VI protein secretion system component VasK